MAEVVYTLKRKKDTEELHLFNGFHASEGRCTSKYDSICKKMNREESSGNVFACELEDEARMLCAKNGRKVCGICVSHLYETYEK